MRSVLFVCHGNICRSPMAEYVMKDLVKKAHAEDRFHIESAAATTEELGNDVYPSAKRALALHHVPCPPRRARQMTKADYDRFDMLLGMDRENIRMMRSICGGDPEGKISLLLSHTPRGGEVADPWYTGDFEAAWDDILLGCECLLKGGNE